MVSDLQKRFEVLRAKLRQLITESDSQGLTFFVTLGYPDPSAESVPMFMASGGEADHLFGQVGVALGTAVVGKSDGDINEAGRLLEIARALAENTVESSGVTLGGDDEDGGHA